MPLISFWAKKSNHFCWLWSWVFYDSSKEKIDKLTQWKANIEKWYNLEIHVCDSFIQLLDTRLKKNEKETKEREKQKPQRHTKTPMITPLLLLKRYQRDESNDTKNVINGDPKGSREQPKDKWVSTPLDCLCEPLHSLFMIFFYR
jgi:hypothetical protein